MEHASELDRYRIIASIGKGGMGEVFRARDTRIDRDVAIKILPAAVASDPDRLRRLEQEARVAGQINHPNVVAIYDVTSVNGAPCIVSELLEGETLGERLARGSIPTAQVIRYAVQIAEGLAAAHRRGIIHRDLKPENIFITTDDDRAKILDFGLAKSLEPAHSDAVTAARATMPGVVFGTVGYMSPEGVRGAAVDQRSDIFGFGAVLFEMLTGRRAFERNSAAETMAAILNEEPPDLSSSPSSSSRTIPAGVVGVLRRCLNKNPDARYQSARDLAFHLEQLSGAVPAHVGTLAGSRRWIYVAVAAVALLLVGAILWQGRTQQPRSSPTATPTSLAVLPFVNMSQNRDDEYFSDGITEEVINALAQVDGLRVAARTSSFAFKGKEADVKTVAKTLAVEHLLEGSVRKSGNRLRVTAQLIDGSSGYHLWSETYDREMSDVFLIQQQIANEIVEKLTATHRPRTAEPARASAAELQAYDLYLKGKFLMYKAYGDSSLDTLRQAVGLFEQAVARNPRLAPAYSGLAHAYAHFHLFAPEESAEESHVKAASAAAQKALKLDPTLAEAHVALGEILLHHTRDVVGAEREFRRAIELNPNSLDAYLAYSFLLLTENRLPEAVASGRVARQLAPLDPLAATYLGQALIYSRKYDEAIQVLREGLQLAPDSAALVGNLGTAHSMRGDHELAIAEQKRSYELSPNPFMRMVCAWGYARAGRRADAERILNEVLNYPPSERDKACHSFAGTYIALGDHDRAIQWLQRGVDVETVFWFDLVASPWFDALRSDPRFSALVRKAAEGKVQRGR